MKFKVHLVRVKSTKTVNIHVEKITKDPDVEIYLDEDDNEVERKMGETMPVYMTIPQEIFDPLLAAGRDGDFG